MNISKKAAKKTEDAVNAFTAIAVGDCLSEKWISGILNPK